MEAIETINQNGSIERTITLNPEESQVTLGRLNSTIRAMVEERLGHSITESPTIQMSAEELERICDEAVGITPQNTMENMFPEDTTPISQEVTNDIIRVGDGLLTQIANIPPITEVNVTNNNEEEDIITEVEYEEPQEETNIAIPLAELNSNFVSDSTARFSSAEWFNIIQTASVLIGGAGGISSWLAMLLARTNVDDLYLYDNDKVETVNLAGQFFRTRDVGKYKVVAVTDILREMSDFYRCTYYKELYTPYSELLPIMMCGFDNMEARKVFFNNWKSNFVTEDKSKCLLLDGRLSAECLQVYCIQGDDDSAVQFYEEHCLFSDEEADATVCSYKQTSFMANMIAGTMVNLFVNWCANRAGGFRPVPFFTEYDAVTMQYKIKMNAV